MGRLLDADVVEDTLRNRANKVGSESAIGLNLAVLELRNIPTAYDVDAVVDEIKNVAVCNDECARTYYYGMGCEACAWNTIMDLVRKGGVNENNN